MEPAKSIIERMGGEAVVAAITGTALSTPYGWQKPKREGGTGGWIPQKYHHALLEFAKEKRKRLKQSDFLLPVTEAAE